MGDYEPNSIFLAKDLRKKINKKSSLEEIRRKKYDFENGHKNLLNSSSFSRNFEMLDVDFSYSGVEERHPFCDIDLMNLCLRIPASQKLKNGKTRNILREALKNDLPKSVYRRMKKSNLSPYFFYSFDLMRDELFERLIYSNSPICELLDKSKLKKLSKSEKLSLDQKSLIVAYNCIESWIQSNKIMNK
jgi:asparagine synthase (glutamine-hydrolysing)